MLKVVEEVFEDGKDLFPKWSLLENAKKALNRGGKEELKRYYERCLTSNHSKGKHVAETLRLHGRKTLESEFARFMEAYNVGSRLTNGERQQEADINVEVSADELARYRRCLDRLLDQIEKRHPDEKLVPRIRRFGRNRQIPRKLEPLMLTVAEIRNASEHDFESPSRYERLAAKNAWNAIVEWASKHGLIVPNG